MWARLIGLHVVRECVVICLVDGFFRRESRVCGIAMMMFVCVVCVLLYLWCCVCVDACFAVHVQYMVWSCVGESVVMWFWCVCGVCISMVMCVVCMAVCGIIHMCRGMLSSVLRVWWCVSVWCVWCCRGVCCVRCCVVLSTWGVCAVCGGVCRVVVCTDIWGNELLRQVGVGVVVTQGAFVV